MKNLIKASILGIFYFLILTSCENEELILSFDSVRIKTIIRSSQENTETTTTYEYNEYNLITKGVNTGGGYFTNEYDSSNRLIQSNSYNSHGLYNYFTFQYDSNSITRIRFQYYPYSDSWGGDNEKSVYIYNSLNNCERIDYYTKDENENWVKSIYYTLCFWNNNNLTEMKNYEGNNLDYISTYQYDNKYNPEKLLTQAISPWTKSKNNPVKISTIYTDGRESNISFSYKYNEYGYPIEKQSHHDICDLSETTKYEYEFK